MSAVEKILQEVEGAIVNSSGARHAVIVGGIADLFVGRAPEFSNEEIALFDEVLTRLTMQIESAARAILASRLGPVPNAPPKVIRRLAFDDAIEVAAPVLSQSERLSDADLVDNARRKSQEHMLAISQRSSLSETVTDVLVERGDQRVLLSVVGNIGAKISGNGFAVLVQRSDDEPALAIRVGARAEIPRYLFRQLIEKASRTVRTKLAAMHPEAFEQIRHIVAGVAEKIESHAMERAEWRETAQPLGKSADQNKRIDADIIQKSADAGDLDAVASSLAATCELPAGFVKQAISERKSEVILVLARAAGLLWPALRAILLLRRAGHSASEEVNRSFAAYQRLAPETAQQILRFYRDRAKNQL